jgi:uncharacterized SAM-binding protein YcdF (DUF218 family)
MSRALELEGVPLEQIIPETRSRSTIENAIYARELLEARHVETVGVVTCDWHLRRALVCFRSVGLEAHPFPVMTPRPIGPRRWLRAVRELAYSELTRACQSSWSPR